MPNYYCEHCGHKASSVASLTSTKCTKHPYGACKGGHKLYEGSEKSKYTCKYCGRTANSIRDLTGGKCTKHPDGSCKGAHAPAL